MVPLMRTKENGLMPAPAKMPEIPLLRGFQASDWILYAKTQGKLEQFGERYWSILPSINK